MYILIIYIVYMYGHVRDTKAYYAVLLGSPNKTLGGNVLHRNQRLWNAYS
jgi:hypothetical protein